MRILLVTSRDPMCGISEHSDALMAFVRQADPSIQFTASAEALNPQHEVVSLPYLRHPATDLIHLNFHAGLHSRWSAAVIAFLRREGHRVIVTYHDTGVPNSDQCKAICAAADAFVVHEPYDDLEGNGRYWRMGVLPPVAPGMLWNGSLSLRPYVGTAGHDFPWKTWNELCRAAAAVGWGVHVCAPRLTDARKAELHALNPWLVTHAGLPTENVLGILRSCDATAFTNVCANTGQSAAILLGIAARKPLIAFWTCRQYRALREADTHHAIDWCETFEDVEDHLRVMRHCRVDPTMVALAEQESWIGLGQRYAQLYHEVVGS